MPSTWLSAERPLAEVERAAVEAYQRRFRDGLYIDEGVFAKEVLEPLVAAITADIS